MSAYDHKHSLWMNRIAMPERTSVGTRRGWRPSAPPIFIRNRDLEPIVTQFGYDPIWFVISVGVVMVEDGSIHPPIGMSVRDPGAVARRQDHQHPSRDHSV